MNSVAAVLSVTETECRPFWPSICQVPRSESTTPVLETNPAENVEVHYVNGVAATVHARPRKLTMTPDWNLLLNNAKNGIEADRNRLFELLRERLLTICGFRLRGWPAEEIEDVVQDSLAVVFIKLDSVNDNPHYFSLTVLENKIGGLLRQRKRRTMISLNPTGSLNEQDEANSELQLPSDSHDEMLDHLHGSEIAVKLQTALKKLSPLCQAIFLALLQLSSVADVWEAYQQREPRLSRNAFDKRLFDCRRKLRDITAGQLA